MLILIDLLTSLVVEETDKDPTSLIRCSILYYYPGRDDIVDCVLAVLHRYRQGQTRSGKSKRKRQEQQQAIANVFKRMRAPIIDIKSIPPALLRQITSFLKMPSQVKALAATSRAHRDELQPLIRDYQAGMEAARQKVITRYSTAYDYYITNNMVGNGGEEEGYPDITDWIINEIVATPYFTIEECLEYAEASLNEDIETRTDDMIDFIHSARIHHDLTDEDYDRIIDCFL